MEYVLTVLLVLCLLASPVYAGRVHTYNSFVSDGNGWAEIADASTSGELDAETDDYMVEFWARSMVLDTDFLVSKGSAWRSAETAWDCLWVSSSEIKSKIADGDTQGVLEGSAIFGINETFYVAVVADRSGNASKYVNGVYDSSIDISGAAGDVNNAIDFSVAAWHDGASPYIGYIYMVRFWKFGVGGLSADIAGAVAEHNGRPWEKSNLLVASECEGEWELGLDYADDSGNGFTLTSQGTGNAFSVLKADRRKIWIK